MPSAFPPSAFPTTTGTGEEAPRNGGAVTGSVALTLRLEAALVLAGSILAYRSLEGSWTHFAALFLVPDLCMLGYLADSRWGARLYNLGHTYLSPVLLALLGLALGTAELDGPALIWAAHIGFDRLVGYGLKYPEAFGATHLGLKGRPSGRD